jgi:hypothetical protein
MNSEKLKTCGVLSIIGAIIGGIFSVQTAIILAITGVIFGIFVSYE